jgi:hypothetical protein
MGKLEIRDSEPKMRTLLSIVEIYITGRWGVIVIVVQRMTKSVCIA